MPVICMLRGAVEIRRVEKLPLQGDANAVHNPRANLAAARELIGHRLQKLIAQIVRDRPSSRHHGRELAVGETNRAHGGPGRGEGGAAAARRAARSWRRASRS